MHSPLVFENTKVKINFLVRIEKKLNTELVHTRFYFPLACVFAAALKAVDFLSLYLLRIAEKINEIKQTPPI